MIISPKYKYLFIEIPLTASYATRHELCEYYAGEPILHKHASYLEFLRIAKSKERDYFVFATVRNPLDVAASRYFKYKTDHKGAFSDDAATTRLIADYSDVRKYRFIADSDASFETYFKRFHRRTFNSIIELSKGHLDFVIRYENLQQDFSEVLRLLGIELVRPIPVMNKTRSKRSDWQSYYTAEIIDQAKRKFGPFMREWDYEFPPDWGAYSPNWREELEFPFVSAAQRIYWLNVRYNKGLFARIARLMRGFFIR